MAKRQEENHLFRYSRVKWVYLVGVLAVIGSIMSFGLVGYFAMHFSEQEAINMLGMILPMSLVMMGCLYIVLRHIEKKLMPLFHGIHAITEGELDVVLNPEFGEEYATIYQDFNVMAKELRATKVEMNNFVNEFTHEFKTPITSIQGFAELLCEDKELSDEEKEEYLHIIAQQSSRLANLSINTLLLSKIEACQIITDRECFSISGQIQNCAILMLKQLEEKGIQLELPEDADIRYYGNQELMEHIWINLLGNAIKFTPRGGLISVSYDDNEEGITVHITDSGKGMSEETISRIFDKYYQEDSDEITKGNGIGLSIVKRIVELYGGEVIVKSVYGEGSTFSVCLPPSQESLPLK